MSSAAIAVPDDQPRWRSPVIPWAHCSTARQQLLYDAWKLGEIDHHLTPGQLRLSSEIDAWELRKDQVHGNFAIDISRRWGKSFFCIHTAIKKCRRNNGWRIVYCAPTYKDVVKFILPLAQQALLDCPDELRPEWVKSEGTFYFADTGSRIEIYGLDRNPDGSRGGGVDYVVLDEAGFFANLEYLATSVLSPQMMGRPHARLLAASTPPTSPSHYWSSTFVPQCINENAHRTVTIDDAMQYSVQEIEREIAKLGGRKSTACRRELLAQHITDSTLAIIPEFLEMEEQIVREWPVPEWRDCYVSMDPGWKDLTGVLFGYCDFVERKLIIEDEIAAPRLNSNDIAKLVKEKEVRLWSKSKRLNPGKGLHLMPQPYKRFSDNDMRLIVDLAREHDLMFEPTQKDNLEQQVNAIRVGVQEGRIIIHPRCKTLIKHLKYGVWKNQRDKVFAWEGGHLGHFDLIAALVYMWRNIRWHRNPSPALERIVRGDLKEPAKQQSKWLKHKGVLRIRSTR